jgi:hypothetical protein
MRSVVIPMTPSKLPLTLFFVAIMLVSATSYLPSAHSSQLVVYSRWTMVPPFIDGKMEGLWAAPQITMKSPDYPIDAFAYFLNDQSNLYVLVDAVGDATKDASDECLLWFGFTNSGTGYTARIVVFGDGHLGGTAGYTAAAGFGGSPNSPTPHMTYEFSIPLSVIQIQPGQSITVCSPEWKGRSIVYDYSTSKDNVWPNGLSLSDVNTWTILQTSLLRTVGGVVVQTNKLELLTPYLALAGLVAIASAVVVVKRRRA